MVKGKIEMTNVKYVLQKKLGTFLNNLSSKLREHGLHAMLSFLSSLPIPVLRIGSVLSWCEYLYNYD